MATTSFPLKAGKQVHALLTGPPGVGKTTLVRKVCSLLRDEYGVQLQGFYTEEVRARGGVTDRPERVSRGGVADHRYGGGGRGPRVGFDVVTFDGTRGPLARVHDSESSHRDSSATASTRDTKPQNSKPIFVGKYQVDLKSFEPIALPSLLKSTSKGQSTSGEKVKSGSMKSYSGDGVHMSNELTPDNVESRLMKGVLRPGEGQVDSQSGTATTDSLETLSSRPGCASSKSGRKSTIDKSKTDGDYLATSQTKPSAHPKIEAHNLEATGKFPDRVQSTVQTRCLFVVDEIGKMELLSREFVTTIKRLFNRKQATEHAQYEKRGSGEQLQCSGEESVVVLATIPMARGRQKSHWLVEELRSRRDCRVYEVNMQNRDALVTEISEFLLNSISYHC